MALIEQSTVEGSTYYSTESRGTRYSLRRHKGEWELYSKRLALGRSSIGSFRFFRSLDELEGAIKAFSGIQRLIGSAEQIAACH
ncbi:hypothetical protein [Stutzerimonas stutzeri]|uniref:hypothetical protein n=1 Tax=Stutzerimonas stutzeri TaxID=316 RepID=UPI0015E347C6|nr:hypothetical protein [Stutzerimonas stutzeri]MBA1280253.1 hypothetical protein [Stutzerimonas stutzeri]